MIGWVLFGKTRGVGDDGTVLLCLLISSQGTKQMQRGN